MPLYCDWHFVGALVSVTAWICLAYYKNSSPSWLYWLLYGTSHSIFTYCWSILLGPVYHEWRQQPVVQFNNAAPANGNAAQLQRGRLQNLPDLPRMLTDVFQCLPRAGLDVCLLVSWQFRDAVEDARTTLPLYPMVVSLSPYMPLVQYDAWIGGVGSITGHFFAGLRRYDSAYFRNASIDLRTEDATYARTSTDMISAFVRSLNMDESNIRFTHFKCEAYADELEGLFRFTDRHHIVSLVVIYKRSLVTPGCDFLSTLFAEARKRSLRRLKVSLASVEAKDNCDIEVQVGFQVLSEIFQEQERPSAEHLTVVVPHLKRFGLLQRIQEAYARGEITRPLTVGCDSSISMAELLPDTVFLFLVGKELSADGRKQATMTVTFSGETTFYKFSLPC